MGLRFLTANIQFVPDDGLVTLCDDECGVSKFVFVLNFIQFIAKCLKPEGYLAAPLMESKRVSKNKQKSALPIFLPCRVKFWCF